jgi:outer membrane protein assembly factor BamB
MRAVVTLLVCLCSIPSSVSTAVAEDWPTWRGPHYNGVAEGEKYPTAWSSSENVAWKIDLPGKGSSTPVIHGDHIFLTCGIEGQNAAVGLNRAGKILWTTKIGSEKGGKNKKATGSNPSAVTDGKHVWVYFKSGDLACLDLQGKIVWQHNLQQKFGEDTLWWDLGTSPVLTKEAVVVAVMHSEPSPSYLVAFTKETGEVKWKQERNLGAPSEAAQSYTTPLVLADAPLAPNTKGELIVVLGADHVTGHDGATGKELWRVGGLNPKQEMYYRSIASAVEHEGIVIAPYARGNTITAVRLGGSGDVTQSHVAWTKQGLGSDVPTPSALSGKVYVCTDKGTVACLDVKTGDTLWSGQTEKHRNGFSASVSIAGGNVYVAREDGKTFVLPLGDQFKVLAANELDGDMLVATPVFVDGKIYLRTVNKLYCIGAK